MKNEIIKCPRCGAACPDRDDIDRCPRCGCDLKPGRSLLARNGDNDTDAG